MATGYKRLMVNTKRGRPVHPHSRYGHHRNEIPRIKAGIDARLKKVLSRIGVPPKRPFKPDPFQLKALAAIRKTDCLVSAPTGSGKTWIAQEAISRIRNKGGRAWYASPLKALSNSKYLEFSEYFGNEDVGILTGDRKENADAPIIVGTTEILRNHLYDAMNEGTDLAADLVVLDEAHFLGDEDRGVVWEEVMIYLPVQIPLLLLSATINNAQYIADWLKSIRKKRCIVIEETVRPVPLFHLFFHPSGKIFPLLGSNIIDKRVQAYLESSNPPYLAPPRQLPPFGEIMGVLRRYDLLPAIFFLKSRADCDAALMHCINGSDQLPSARQTELNERIDGLIEGHSYLEGHRQLWYLKNAAVAAHHSGQLPTWKLVIEHLMDGGLLDAVFATSTVAAGVNFPARSIVLFNSDRYNGHKFIPLNATEFHQTTGRAGRRGKDNIGFALVVPGKFMDIRLISKLCTSPSEDVQSQIKIDFSMVLNLLLSHRLEEIKDIFQRSFATHMNMVNQQPWLYQKLEDTGLRLMSFLPESLCSNPEFVLNLIRRHAALIREVSSLKRRLKGAEIRLSKLENLIPGRLFLDQRDRIYCVIRQQVRRNTEGVLACRVGVKTPHRGKRMAMKWFRPERVSKFLDSVIDSAILNNPQKIKELSVQIAKTDMPPILSRLPISEKGLLELSPLKSRMRFIEGELEGMICNKCGHFKTCHRKIKDTFRHVFDEFALMWDTANTTRERLWNEFVRHLEFLKEESFVTEDNRLTEDGFWASQLRLDQPLMIVEGLRRNLLPDDNPALLAALIAPFVYDREIEIKIDESSIPRHLLKAYERIKKGLNPLMERKEVRGFIVRPVFSWPAAVIYAWAIGQSWKDVLEISGINEGDLAMLISRTADNLRQISSLIKVYPAIAQCALDAISMLLREPVIMH